MQPRGNDDEDQSSHDIPPRTRQPKSTLAGDLHADLQCCVTTQQLLILSARQWDRQLAGVMFGGRAGCGA